MIACLIDMPSGLSGDMLLAALLAAGGDKELLLRDLQALGIDDIDIDRRQVKPGGITATQIDVHCSPGGELGPRTAISISTNMNTAMSTSTAMSMNTAMSTNTAMSMNSHEHEKP